MLLNILGLPLDVKYSELKEIIKNDCNIENFLLDNMVLDEDKRHKKVRIGLADESEGERLMQALNGCKISGQVITVAPIVKTIQSQAKPSGFGKPPHAQGQYMVPTNTQVWQAAPEWSGPQETPFHGQNVVHQNYPGQFEPPDKGFASNFPAIPQPRTNMATPLDSFQRPNQYQSFGDQPYREQPQAIIQPWEQPSNQPQRSQFDVRTEGYINKPIALNNEPIRRPEDFNEPIRRPEDFNEPIRGYGDFNRPIRRQDDFEGPIRSGQFSKQRENPVFPPKEDVDDRFRRDEPFPKRPVRNDDFSLETEETFGHSRWGDDRDEKRDYGDGNIRREVSYSRVSPDRQSFNRQPSPRGSAGRFSPHRYDHGRVGPMNNQPRPAYDTENLDKGKRFEERQDFEERNQSFAHSEERRPRHSRSPVRRGSPERDHYHRSRSPRSPKRPWNLDRRSPKINEKIRSPPVWSDPRPDNIRKSDKKRPIWEKPAPRQSRFEPAPDEQATSPIWKKDYKSNVSKGPRNEDNSKSSFAEQQRHKGSRLDNSHPQSRDSRKQYPENPRNINENRNTLRRDAKHEEDPRGFKRDFPGRHDRSPPRKEPRLSEATHSRERPRSRNNDRQRSPVKKFEDSQREIAVNTISFKICEKNNARTNTVHDELKILLHKEINNTFGNREVSSSDLLAWFSQKYSSRDEQSMLSDVMLALKRKEESSMDRRISPKPKTESKPMSQKEQLKEKYKQTIDEIRRRLLIRKHMKPLHEDFKPICEELGLTLLRILLKFGEKYGPQCDISKMYKMTFSERDEDKIYQDVLESVHKNKTISTKGYRPSEMATDSAAEMNRQDDRQEPSRTQSRWDVSYLDTLQSQLNTMPAFQNNFDNQLYIASQGITSNDPATAFYMPPVDQSVDSMSMSQIPYVFPQNTQFGHPEVGVENTDDSRLLYVCKVNFGSFSKIHESWLREYLVSKIFETTADSGFAPNFSFKGLQTPQRYEILAEDDDSRDWLLNFDFKNFALEVVVYTKEQLWYERAAIWLPEQSKFQMAPLKKLKLQNKHMEGIDIGKWVLVKPIVTAKGTRIYVDMPPSAARVLEAHKMLLSYELQKVSVFMRAAAVDKNVFDSGLTDASINDPAKLQASRENAVMPVLIQEPNMVKISLKNEEGINLAQAKLIKDRIVYNIFTYHQQPHANSKTDFIKYGFCYPGFLGILPENKQSEKWLRRLELGKIKNDDIIIISDEVPAKHYFRFNVSFPRTKDSVVTPQLVIGRLKTSNKGLNGLNFDKWNVIHFNRERKNMDLDIDMESVEKLMALNFRLDYQNTYITFRHKYRSLKDDIEKRRREMKDSYHVADMELDSNEEDY